MTPTRSRRILRAPLLAALASTLALGVVACGEDEVITAKNPRAKGGSGGGAGRGGQAGALAGGAGGRAGTGGGTAGGGGTVTAGAGGSAVSGAGGVAGVKPTGGSAGVSASGGGGVGGGGASAKGGAAGSGAAAGSSAGTSAQAGSPGSGGSTSGACGKNCTGGVCLGDVCCAPDRACGSVCCKQGAICAVGACVVPGKTCLDASECASTELCDLSLGKKAPAAGGQCASATSPSEGKCLPRPPQCASGQTPTPENPTCVQKCEFKPAAIPFTPTVAYTWGGDVAGLTTDVMMAPIVVQLDDDDCDGTITNRDLPEIVFTSFTGVPNSTNPTSGGTLRALTVKNGQLVEKWKSGPDIFPGGAVAGGNFDGKPGNEVVACLAGGPDGKGFGVRAFDGATGAVLWTAPNQRCSAPAIADLEHDGKVSVIVEGAILNGSDGTVRHNYATPFAEGTFAIADINGDNYDDIVGSTIAYSGVGAVIANTNLKGAVTCCGAESGPAIADLDGDGKPEVVATLYESRSLLVWKYEQAGPDGANTRIIRQGLNIDGGLPDICTEQKNGGGPVTIGRFNDDAVPDVALAGAVGYVVLDGKKLVSGDPNPFLWGNKTQDCSSAGTGSSLFDFNGDGKAEVVYADELALHIYEGATGKVLFETCNTSRTLNEQPIIADIDNDGHADLLVVSNAYSREITCPGGQQTSGLRVFSDPQKRWVRTRSVWNQHAYSVTNIGEDGAVPQEPAQNFKDPTLNNYRQNKQPGQEFAAPDGIISLALPTCNGPYALVARVANVGEAPLPAGATVGFYLGAPGGGSLIGKAVTKGTIYPAQSELVQLSVPSLPPGLSTGSMPFHVRFDDTAEPHPAWTECRTDNNLSKAVSGSCGKD